MALLALLVFPGAAQADALWTFFAARCLAPFEAIEAPDTSGLTRLGTAWHGEGFEMRFDAQSCEVRGGTPGNPGDLLTGMEEYEFVDGVWRSTTWREPKIEVSTVEDGYRVFETDLEA